MEDRGKYTKEEKTWWGIEHSSKTPVKCVDFEVLAHPDNKVRRVTASAGKTFRDGCCLKRWKHMTSYQDQVHSLVVLPPENPDLPLGWKTWSIWLLNQPKKIWNGLPCDPVAYSLLQKNFMDKQKGYIS